MLSFCVSEYTTFMLSFCLSGSATFMLHCKKGWAIFPPPAGRSVTKLSVARNNLINPGMGEYGYWLLVSDIPAGDGKIANLFYCVSCCTSRATTLMLSFCIFSSTTASTLSFCVSGYTTFMLSLCLSRSNTFTLSFLYSDLRHLWWAFAYSTLRQLSWAFAYPDLCYLWLSFFVSTSMAYMISICKSK